ncbi:DUF1877 family protein [Micromonospora arida]|uniref:DUF1877 family protein n=1 Tax=Micromonospora arida TaxID=2203715 RepID=UPI0033FB099C
MVSTAEACPVQTWICTSPDPPCTTCTPAPPGRSTAVLGGEEIGDDGGYGPARLLDVETVRVVAIALGMLDVDPSRDRFRPRRPQGRRHSFRRMG